MGILRALSATLVVATMVAAACSSSKKPDLLGDAGAGAPGDAGPDVAASGSGGSAGAGASTGSGGEAGSSAAGTAGMAGAGGTPPLLDCGVYGDACQQNVDCCSMKCNDTTGTCDPALVECKPAAAQCSSPLECCSMRCESGSCAADACVQDNQACTSGDQCCSGRCDGTCVPLNTSCKTAGNACTDGADCCSKLCAGGVCKLASSFCSQEGDACSRADECCSGSCLIASGASLGVCGPPIGSGGNCGGVQGTVCSGCGDCCSRLCAPYGPTGVLICQPASGCRVMGELCLEDADCCGGDTDNGLPGAGNVTCEKASGATYGRCRSPTSGPLWPACNPQGNICHYQDYACGNSSSRANCCGTKKAACKLDALGIPRCGGLDACREPGETCASAADCCNDLPCVPDANGDLRCMVPSGGGPTCVPEGGACTYTGDCCVGFTCIIPVGASQGVCGTPETVPPGDGGTEPPPTCAQYGQTCKVSADCCNQVPCTDGICRFSAN